jgi:bacterioferritin-associated ferredoxin
MAELKRLAGITHISQAQEKVVDHLWRMTGECAGGCGTILTESSPKSCMGTINTRHCVIQQVRNTIGISLYCGSCTEKLSALIRQFRVPKSVENKPITAGIKK